MNVTLESLLESRIEKGGKLFIRGTRISVNFIARFWRMGVGAEKIIEEYPHIPPAGIHAALAYYFANQTNLDIEIDKEIAEEKRFKSDFLKTNRQKEAA